MSKFKVGDWVRCNCPHAAWQGTTAEVTKCDTPYYKIKNHLGELLFHESWLTPTAMPPAAVPSGSNPRWSPSVPQATSDVPPSNVQPSKVLRSKIEPVCPACGSKSEFNYVGFSSVECINSACAHFRHELFVKHCEARIKASKPIEVPF